MGEVPPSGVTLVALPYVSKQGFTGPTTQSLILSILGGGMRMTKFLFLGDFGLVQARNAACQDALDSGAEWLFFVDSDADFPVETLGRLKACDSDVACVDMWSRNIPSFRTVMRLAEQDEGGRRRAIPYRGSGIDEVDLCGMHCTLIRTSLLRKMKRPWFWSAEHGEDATFCFGAREVGGIIKCDYGITAGHWGVARIAGQEWTRDAKNQPMAIANLEMMRRMDVKGLPN